jgi:two-component system, NarL family, nitrate/nitrite response regulator NarL
MPSIRVLIADDHALFRACLRMLLESEPGFEVVGEAADGAQAVELAARLRPDLALLDVSMPRMSGLEALERITRQCPYVRTIMLTAQIERWQTILALRLGARGVVLKDATSALLYRCLHNVRDGGLWIDHAATPALVAALRQVDDWPRCEPAPMARLTVRELQIVGAITDGASNEDISLQFGMRPQTVKNHLHTIFTKLGLSNRRELALYAVNHDMESRTQVFAMTG